MRVTVAKTAGFCWGVRRAMDAVLDISSNNKQGNIQTLGPLIHNPQALKLIEKRGVSIVANTNLIKDGIVIIRAHGIPIQNLIKLKERQHNGKISIVNATCPEVAKVQSRIKKWSPKGYFTIILGTHDHAESVAHQSFAKHGSVIVANLEEAKALPDALLVKVLIVAQTTFIDKNFHEISEHIRNRCQDCVIENTICKDTWIRQNEAKSIAQTVDYVIVVGGKTSSNTKHLAELAANLGKPVQHVETATEIDFSQFSINDHVGIIAGASTPTWLVDEVANVLKQYGKNSGILNFINEHFIKSIKLALGVGFLAIGACHWVRLPLTWHYPTIAACHTLAMCLLAPCVENLNLRTKGLTLAKILEVNYNFMTLTAILALAVAFLTSYHLGLMPIIIISITSILGVAYNQELKFSNTTLSLKSIPGSKDIVLATTIGIVTLALPILHVGQPWNIRSWSGMILVTSLVFARTTIHHLKDMQNDQILGKETLPILFGRRITKILFMSYLAIAFIITTIVNFLQPATNSWLVVGILIACIGYTPLYLWLSQKHLLMKKYKIEPLSDMSFIILSLLSLT